MADAIGCPKEVASSLKIKTSVVPKIAPVILPIPPIMSIPTYHTESIRVKKSSGLIRAEKFISQISGRIRLKR